MHIVGGEAELPPLFREVGCPPYAMTKIGGSVMSNQKWLKS
jgi:hypothetical protein